MKKMFMYMYRASNLRAMIVYFPNRSLLKPVVMRFLLVNGIHDCAEYGQRIVRVSNRSGYKQSLRVGKTLVHPVFRLGLPLQNILLDST